MSNEMNDEMTDDGFEGCLEDAHEGCGGPWWHELTLEQRALHTTADGDGPWWAQAALEVVGEPVFEIAVSCDDEGCDASPREDALTMLQDTGDAMLDVAQLLGDFLTKKEVNVQEVGAALFEMAHEADHVADFLHQIVRVTFPNDQRK